MAYKTVLVDLTDDGARQARLDAAFALAADANGRVIGLSATGPMLDPYRSVGAETMRYQAMHADMLRGVEQAGTQALSDACARHGTPTDYSHVLAEQDAGWALATHGMASDIILPGLPGAPSELPVLMASAAEYALVNAGRPMLVVPPQARLSKIDTALVAWNGRREAARAVCDALPLLQRANRVILLVVMGGKGLWQHGDGELLRWLGTHGVQASLVVEESSSVAGCLLQKALQVSADLLVAGGYGHSRIGELMTGGTTRTLLRNTPVPLLISH